MDLAARARHRANTIHSRAAARPAKGTSRNGIPAIAITGTMDGARATSVDEAGNASRTDHAEAAGEAAGIRVDKEAAAESRYRARL